MDAFIVFLGVVIFTILLLYFLCIRTSSRDVRDTSYDYNSDTAGWSVYNESKRLEPYTLDLHKYSLAAAKIAVPEFLKQRISDYKKGGSDLAFIITGRGNHSVDGPKIKPMVEKYLQENRYKNRWDDHGGRVRVFL